MNDASDLIYEALEYNAERYEEIRNMLSGLGIPADHASEYFGLRNKQARLYENYLSALRAEGRSVNDISALVDNSPVAAEPGLRIKNRGDAVVVWMYGVIGEDFTAADLKNEMARFPSSPIELHVNSEGGSVQDGVAIAALIKAHAAPVDVVVDSLAASAASFSIMPARSIAMATGSYMMVHYVSASLSDASAESFEAATKRLKEMNKTLKDFYKPRWKGTDAQLDAALLDERYFSAHEAVAAGLADQVLDAERVAACVSRDHQLKGMPAELSIAARGGPSQFLNHPSRQMILHRLVTS